MNYGRVGKISADDISRDRKMKMLLLAPAVISLFLIFYIGDAFSRDYQGAGETSDSFILVDADQLRSMMLKGSTIAFIKTIRHYKTQKILGLMPICKARDILWWQTARTKAALSL
jgi:hypothetical protein